jgi:hypothetical protein
MCLDAVKPNQEENMIFNQMCVELQYIEGCRKGIVVPDIV